MIDSLLDSMIQRAVDDLQSATGGEPLCARSGDGRTLPAAKYHEGRWAALSEVKRSGGRSQAEEIRQRWMAERERLVERAAHADWIAYATGGVDALTAYLTE